MEILRASDDEILRYNIIMILYYSDRTRFFTDLSVSYRSIKAILSAKNVTVHAVVTEVNLNWFFISI